MDDPVVRELEAAKAVDKELEEAAALEDVSHMPARVKCAVLGWHTLENILTIP